MFCRNFDVWINGGIPDLTLRLILGRVTLKTEKKRIKRNGASKSISPISVSFRFARREQGGHRAFFVFRFGFAKWALELFCLSFRFREVSTSPISVSFRFVSRGEHRARFLFRFVPRGFSALYNYSPVPE
jgi:hypothetical protein